MILNWNVPIVIIDGDKTKTMNEKSINQLGKISIRKFKPKTAKKGKETTERKKDLREAFIEQNKNRLPELQEKCKEKQLSLDITFYLNENTPDKSSYKKDLDNLLKILLDVIKEEMDDDKKKIGLGLVVKNKDEEVFEINCHKEFVSSDDDEGIDLVVSEWKK
jgi:Holliday junction resolvase RusA-like endonuclease